MDGQDKVKLVAQYLIDAFDCRIKGACLIVEGDELSQQINKKDFIAILYKITYEDDGLICENLKYSDTINDSNKKYKVYKNSKTEMVLQELINPNVKIKKSVQEFFNGYTTPYLECIVFMINKLNISDSNQPKKDSLEQEIEEYFTKYQPDISLSKHMKASLATIMRTIDSQAGRNKKVPSE